MKVRSGYVSNSSSSSFILAWNDGDFVKCDRCGHKPEDPVIMCEQEDCCYSGDSTEVDWIGVEGWVRDYEEELRFVKQEIDNLERRSPTDLAYPRWNNQQTVREALASAYHTEEKLNDAIARIRKWAKDNPGMSLAQVSISYGSPLNNTIEDMIHRGVVVQLHADDLPATDNDGGLHPKG